MDVRRAGIDDMLAAGLVLTGGSANLPGIDALAEQVLRMPARIGVPRGIHGLSDILANPSYATGVGLLHWALRQQPSNGRKHHEKRPPGARSDLLGTIGRWLRILLPQ
jgi:cell division protein FtsA